MQCRKCDKEIMNESIFCSFCGVKQTMNLIRGKPKTRGNGTGSVYRIPNNKWRASVTLGYTEDGRRIYKTKSDFRTKKEGLEYLQKLKEDSVKAKDIFFSELYEEWIKSAENSISESTAAGYKNCYKKYCKSIKNKKLSNIKIAELQKCIDECDKSPRMKQLVKVTLTSIFKYAEQNDYVFKNYAKFIKVPKQIKPDKDAFTEKEIAQIWSEREKGNSFMKYVLIMIYTGLRPVELRQITSERLNLAEKNLIAGVKTEKGINRKIPLCDKVIPLLSDINLDFTRDEFYKYYKEAFNKTAIRYLPPHCCRHTTATALVLAGVEPKIIQDILGHSSFSVTADNYVHIPMDEKIAAVNKIK